jgi:hypothetical protein
LRERTGQSGTIATEAAKDLERAGAWKRVKARPLTFERLK